MALKALVQAIDDVDEKYRDLYVENSDGTFRLDAEGIEDVTGLKNALQRERDLNKKKKDEGNSGLTAAERQELEDLRKDREANETKQLESEKNWRGLEDRLKKKNSEDAANALKALEAEQGKTKTVTSSLYNMLKENAATKAIAASKGKVGPLLPHVMNNLDVVEEDGGGYKVIVKGKDGQLRYSKEKPTEPMSVEDLVKNDFLSNDDFGGVFEGKGHSGGGAQGGGSGRGNGGTVTISRADAKDASKYRAAKELAVKSGQGAPVVVD